MPRRLVVLPLLALALFISACGPDIDVSPYTPGLPQPFTSLPALQDTGAEQLDAIGDVRLSTTVCLGALGGDVTSPPLEGQGGPSCQDRRQDALDLLDCDLAGVPLNCDAGGSGEARRTRRGGTTHADVAKAAFDGVSLQQVLVSYRVPAGAIAPDEIEAAVAEDAEHTEALGDRATCVYQKIRSIIPVETDQSCEELVSEGTPRQVPEFPDTVALTRSDSLAAGLDELEPAPAGQKWVGYVSEQIPWALTGSMTVNADFGLPRPAGGTPYAGPFEHATRLGLRSATTDRDVDTQRLLRDAAQHLGLVIDDDFSFRDARGGAPQPVTAELGDYAPDRAVDCDEELPPVELLDDVSTGGLVTAVPADSTVCAFPPPNGLDTEGTLATGDLRVTGGAASAEQGQVAAVPFTLDYEGAAAPVALDLHGESDVPFSSATTLASWKPGAGQDRTESVRVAVPDDARPGVYDVLLQVGSGDEVREAVGRLTVTARARAEQVRTITERFETTKALTVERLFVGRDGSVAFGFVCPAELAAACEKGVADVLASASALNRAGAAAAGPAKMKKLGSAKFRAKPGKRVRVKVTLGRSGRKAIAKGRRIDARLVLRVGKYKQVRKISLRRG
jgi:hypothetical protein